MRKGYKRVIPIMNERKTFLFCGEIYLNQNGLDIISLQKGLHISKGMTRNCVEPPIQPPSCYLSHRAPSAPVIRRPRRVKSRRTHAPPKANLKVKRKTLTLTDGVQETNVASFISWASHPPPPRNQETKAVPLRDFSLSLLNPHSSSPFHLPPIRILHLAGPGFIPVNPFKSVQFTIDLFT